MLRSEDIGKKVVFLFHHDGPRAYSEVVRLGRRGATLMTHTLAYIFIPKEMNGAIREEPPAMVTVVKPQSGRTWSK